MTFHRPDFQKVLLAKLPTSYRIHCSKRLRSHNQRQGGPISLLFEDGTEAKCDILLGADGLKSAVRRSLLGEKAQQLQAEKMWSEAADMTALIEPTWSGTNAYRALIPAERLKARHPHHRVLTQPTQVSFFYTVVEYGMVMLTRCLNTKYLGKNGVRLLNLCYFWKLTIRTPYQYVLAYPIAKGKFVNFVAFKMQHDLEGTKFNGSWVCQTDKSECSGTFKNWEPEVQALMDVRGSHF